MSPSHTPPIAFEPEFIEGVRAIFEEKIAFNQVLGLKVLALTPTSAHARITMRPDLIGHYSHHRVHGGVISACLDTTGALAVMGAIGARHSDETPARCLQRFAKLGTIDMRIDYLRPGLGEYFDLRAEVLRLGSRVASTRMEFLAADGKLLSTGAATYIVS